MEFSVLIGQGGLGSQIMYFLKERHGLLIKHSIRVIYAQIYIYHLQQLYSDDLNNQTRPSEKRLATFE